MTNNKNGSMMKQQQQQQSIIIRHVQRGQALNLSCPIDISSLIMIDHYQLNSNNNNNFDQSINDEFEFVWSLNGEQQPQQQQSEPNFIRSNVNHIEYRSISLPLNVKNFSIKNNNQQQQQQQIILVNNAVLVIKNDTKIFNNNNNNNIGHIQCWLRNKKNHSTLFPFKRNSMPCEYEIHLSSSTLSLQQQQHHQQNSDNSMSFTSLLSNDDDDDDELIENRNEFQSTNHHCQISNQTNDDDHQKARSIMMMMIKIDCQILGK